VFSPSRSAGLPCMPISYLHNKNGLSVCVSVHKTRSTADVYCMKGAEKSEEIFRWVFASFSFGSVSRAKSTNFTAGVVCWQVKLCDPHLMSALEVRFSRRCTNRPPLPFTFYSKRGEVE